MALQLGVQHLITRSHLKRRRATRRAGNLDAFELRPELGLQLLGGRLITSRAAILDVDGQRHW